MTDQVEDLRPIHYMGNKSRFLDVIQATVEAVAKPASTACDVFAGTGVVSRRLAYARPVISADIQAYSAILASALTAPRSLSQAEVVSLRDEARAWVASKRAILRELLEIEKAALAGSGADPRPLADLLEYGSLAVTGTRSQRLVEAKDAARQVLDPAEATLTWYYGGVYFSYHQAMELDALRHACRTLWGPDRDRTAVAALLGVASDTVSTVGNHFAQPVQPRRSDGTLKGNWVSSLTRSRQSSVFSCFDSWLARYGALPSTPYPCRTVQADFRDTLSTLGPEVGVIYADPPYTRDHYSRFYHVLETIALDDDPGVTPAAGSSEPGRGLYRGNRHQSPFSIRSQARAAFQELFSHAKRLDVPLVLSYSPMSAGTKARPETRLMSIEDIVILAGDYFADVRSLEVASSSHSRFNKLELNATNEGIAEVLIIASNN